MRAAVIGAGPAGFYACDKLLAAGFEVDLLDALPTPFGLVRSGVAPDHPNIKAVTRVYEKTAAKPGFRFFGGVVLGEQVSRAELVDRYHAVVYGPSGVIGTNKKDAADTVAKIVEDAEAGRLDAAKPDADEIAAWLATCAPEAVTWEGWQAIDEHERAAGEPHGRPRVKLVRLADLLAAGRGVPAGRN
jgi:NADPH-dependent glutamate synthase beta subunit-like oxidoreductase